MLAQMLWAAIFARLRRYYTRRRTSTDVDALGVNGPLAPCNVLAVTEIHQQYALRCKSEVKTVDSTTTLRLPV